MKVLVTGARGQLGYDVINRLNLLGISCLGVDIDDFNICNQEETNKFIVDYNPDAVIHCAAYTAVDKAEDEKELCYKINVTGTENVLSASKQINAKFMYISTDYVFNGKGDTFFLPDDAKSPCNYYGETKLLGEQIVSQYENSFIVRISWVFGQNGNNFIKTMLKLSETRDELSVVCDQIGSPTYTYDLAKLLCEMIQTHKFGVYHATNEGICSWSDFAEYIFMCAGKDIKVNAIPSTNYPTKAVRPLNSRLNKDKLDQEGFERLPDWKLSVQKYINELLAKEK